MPNIIFRVKGGGDLRPIATVGDHHTCHRINLKGPHRGGPIVNGSPHFTAGGKPVARVGDKCHCLFSTDEIEEGVNHLLINGKPAAAVGSKCKHGGIITTGAANVLVGERFPASPPVWSCPPTDEELAKFKGEHWTQAQWVGAEAGTPWKIRTVIEDGSFQTFEGVLDSEGKTDKIPNLAPGQAHIEFGPRETLRSDISKYWGKLNSVLHGIVEKIQPNAEPVALEDTGINSKLPDTWKDRFYHTIGALNEMNKMWWHYLKLKAEDLWHTTQEDSAHLVQLFKGISQIQAYSDIERIAALQGNEDIFNQAEKGIQQSTQLIKDSHPLALGEDILNAMVTVSILRFDPEFAGTLTRFPGRLFESKLGMIVDKETATTLGGQQEAYMLAFLTKDPEMMKALVDAGVSEGEVDLAIQTAEDAADTIKAYRNTAEIQEAELDRVHQVYKAPEGIDEGAEYLPESQSIPYPGYESMEDLQHPAGEEYPLYIDDARNFNGEPVASYTEPGEWYVRIFDKNNPKSNPNGSWWLKLSQKPTSKAEWRSLYAILEEWNANRAYALWQADKEIPLWRGKSATQAIDREMFPNWYLKGGKEQFFIPSSKQDIPIESLQIGETELWGW